MSAGRVFFPVRMPDHLYPVKPWAVACTVAPDKGVPCGRTIHYHWTQRGAEGAAAYLNQLLREDLTAWLRTLPVDARAARPSSPLRCECGSEAEAGGALEAGERSDEAQHSEGRQARRGSRVRHAA